MKKRAYLILILAIILVGCGEKRIVCTEDAKLCPDGTAVGRIPPNCEFAECPEEPEDLESKGDYRCGSYTRDEEVKEVCATCGNGICEEFEKCTPSDCSDVRCTADCGSLYCEEDCGITESKP